MQMYLYDMSVVTDELLVIEDGGGHHFGTSGGVCVHSHPATGPPGHTCTPTAVKTASPSAPPW